jgi:hypothetical protein
MLKYINSKTQPVLLSQSEGENKIMANWIVEKDKLGYYHVREDEKGKYEKKDDAIEAGKQVAKKDKTTLRIHKVDTTGYDQFDYSNAKSPKEIKTANKENVAKANDNLTKAKEKLATAKAKVKDAKDKAKAKADVKAAKVKVKEAKAKLKEAKAK